MEGGEARTRGREDRREGKGGSWGNNALVVGGRRPCMYGLVTRKQRNV